MPDTKISALNELAVEPAVDDLIPVVDTSAVETKKFKWQTLKALFPTHALATAANDFLVASGSGAWVKKTLAEVLAILGVPATGAINYVYKSADETVNNSTALQNDDHLVIPVAANEVIGFELFCYASAPSTTPDFKCGWSVPAGCSMIWTKYSYTGVTASNLAMNESATDATGLDNGTTGFRYYGVIFSGANAGSVQFQWAQNTATVADVTLKKGSNIIYWKLG